MSTVGICMGCGAQRERRMIDISILSDPEPRYLPGAWDPCACGEPMVAEPAPVAGSAQGPPVPTPENILHAAGHYDWWR